MTDRPAGDVAAERAVASLLCRVPETWSAYDGNGLTEPEEKALLQLTAAAMVQRRMRLRLRIIGHPVSVHATVTATGEHGMAEAMEAVAAGAWLHWKDTVQQRSENEPKPFHCEQVGADEWRLTAEGITAKADVERGEAEMVLDFVLKRGFFDGQPRVMPDGRVSQRLPVRGYGKAERLEFVNEGKADPVGPTVAVNNWAEGAQAIADALAPMLGPMTAQNPTAPHYAASVDGSPPGRREPSGFMGVTALAKVLGVPETKMDRFKKRLERERRELGDDAFHEVRDPRPNSPKYLYNAGNPRIRDIAAEYAE